MKIKLTMAFEIKPVRTKSEKSNSDLPPLTTSSPGHTRSGEMLATMTPVLGVLKQFAGLFLG